MVRWRGSSTDVYRSENNSRTLTISTVRTDTGEAYCDATLLRSGAGKISPPHCRYIAGYTLFDGERVVHSSAVISPALKTDHGAL